MARADAEAFCFGVAPPEGGHGDLRVTPDPPRAAPTRVAAPPPLPLSPASSASAPSTADSGSDDDAWEAGARAPREVRDARERDSRDGLEGLRATLTRHGFGMGRRRRGEGAMPHRRPGDLPGSELDGQDPLAAGSGPLPPARARRRRQGASQGDRRARRKRLRDDRRRGTGPAPRHGPAAAPREPRPDPSAGAPPPAGAADDDFDELYSPEAGDDTGRESSDDDDVPLSQWQAQAAAAPWAVGDKVEAKFCVKGGQRSNRTAATSTPATITAVHGATVDVDYDTSDEETEEQLPLRHVRKRRRAAPSASAAAPPKKKTKKAPAKTAHPRRRALAPDGAVLEARHPVPGQRDDHGVHADEARGV